MSESESPSPAPESGPQIDEDSVVVARSFFVRERNALLVRADFAPIYVDYYLHLMDHGLRNEGTIDSMLKDLLGTMVLHATTRPWKETHAWTLNVQEPLVNLFVTASSLVENVIGRAFTDGVRKADKGIFASQIVTQSEEPRKSLIELESPDVFEAVESYYRQSEQRLGRLFRYNEEEFALISAQPDCDLEWLEGLDNEAVRNLDQTETLGPLESRRFRFHCGCTMDRIYPAIAPLIQQGMDDLFQDQQTLVVTCPRCAAKWSLTREQLEAIEAERNES